MTTQATSSSHAFDDNELDIEQQFTTAPNARLIPPKTVTPGSSVHFALLGVLYGYNLLTGKDYEKMQAFASRVWTAATTRAEAQHHAALAQVLTTWERRSRDAFPSDAMLINRHIRELSEALPLNAQAEAAGTEPVLSSALQAVLSEVQNATQKFPTWPTDPLHALGIVGEEFGELSKDVLQLTYEPHKSTIEMVRSEALQTAAMAVRFYMSVDRYRALPCAQHTQRGPETCAAGPVEVAQK